MKVPNVTPTKLMVTNQLNKGRKYVMNEVVDIIANNRVPYSVSNEGIRIEAPKDSGNMKHVVNDLLKSGIKFSLII